jgi:hypothetical protein
LALHVSYLNAPLWTIKVELVCSALLPFLLFADKFFKRKMFSIPAITILLFLYYRFGPENLSATKYLVYFFLGYVAFKLMPFSMRISVSVSIFLLVTFFWFFPEFCGWMESAMRTHRDGNTRSNSLRTLRKNAWTYRRLEGFWGGFATGRQALGTAFGLGEERGDLPGMWREHEPA